MIFECLLFGLENRGLPILLLPDVSPASVAGIFRGPGSWVVARNLRGETSGRRSISRPRFLSPKSKHSNISADRESLNQCSYGVFLYINKGNIYVSAFIFFIKHLIIRKVPEILLHSRDLNWTVIQLEFVCIRTDGKQVKEEHGTSKVQTCVFVDSTLERGV